MPKKNGKANMFSFDETTIMQIEALMEFYKLNKTSLIEFLINKEYKEKISHS